MPPTDTGCVDPMATELGSNVPFTMYFEAPCLMLQESLGPG